jgi:non-lysosomal glucosylceramidase
MTQEGQTEKCSSSCSCHQTISRRDFVELVGLGAAALTAGLPVMAGPFETSDFEKLVPADKKLDKKWVASLFARGARTVYHGKELEKIGMPVGGLCSGQVYVGGDGRLWNWDIFNGAVSTGDAHYAQPPAPAMPVFQGFALTFSGKSKGGWSRSAGLDLPEARDPASRPPVFSDITFCGEYPIAFVEYKDATQPLTVSMEVFSPFIPLNVDDSSLPATIYRIKIKNVSDEPVKAELFGVLDNAVCRNTQIPGAGTQENRTVRNSRITKIECSVRPTPPSARPEIVLEDFEKETYEGWQVEGTAFGKGPVLKSNIPGYQGDVGGPGQRVVNSHASAPGSNVAEKDGQVGKLTSRRFAIERNFITFWIGGGCHPGKTCVNLVIDGKVVNSATGQNDNRMRLAVFNVRKHQRKSARFEIVDQETGAWGNIGVGRIAMTDNPVSKLEERPDFGTMVLGLLDPEPDDQADCDMECCPSLSGNPGTMVLGNPRKPSEASLKLEQRSNLRGVVAGLKRSMTLQPGEEKTATYLIAWHFPNLTVRDGAHYLPAGEKGRYYANRFASAAAVADYVAEHFERLAAQTRLWHDTWYDSTLPYWFLDRTLANTSTLATSTCHRFKTGRFYAWEGVGCCEGTCTHVWHYAQAVGRLFPELERDLRKRVDFGIALNPQTGVINHRGEPYAQTPATGLAVDGQAGCILRAYREHLVSADGTLLRQLWPKIKLAMQCLMKMDNGEGILEGPQHNTLDQPWFGKIAWLSSLYLAAARACEEMAKEIGDRPFADKCREVVARGSRSIDAQLFNGEYYIQIADKAHRQTVGSHDGCEIDQVMGESWAWQVGLGRILKEENVKKALASLWKYNFAPDVGPFRKRYPAGRWYAMAGEAGLLMCSWPRGDKARVQQGCDFYFNECMTGFEYQVAGHLIWEGMIEQGLAVVRAIHDRYHAARRNPWNEVECGDHYARAMASYGVFLAACGYEYHGPKGESGFAPRLTPDDFRAAFTTAEGWGTFSQRRDEAGQSETIRVHWGKLQVRTLSFVLADQHNPSRVTVTVAGKAADSSFTLEGDRIRIALAADSVVEADQAIHVRIERT